MTVNRWLSKLYHIFGVTSANILTSSKYLLIKLLFSNMKHFCYIFCDVLSNNLWINSRMKWMNDFDASLSCSAHTVLNKKIKSYMKYTENLWTKYYVLQVKYFFYFMPNAGYTKEIYVFHWPNRLFNFFWFMTIIKQLETANNT